jgi:hypothetical protein
MPFADPGNATAVWLCQRARACALDLERDRLEGTRPADTMPSTEVLRADGLIMKRETIGR